MTTRTIPPGLAPVLEALELEQPRVVTTAQLAGWARQSGVRWPTDVVVRRLRERGWLLDLATKGVWEFAPAARAGAYSSGDPLIELRATLARDPSAPYSVAAESAAYALGLSSRYPERDVIGAPREVRLPQALEGLRIVRWKPALPAVVRDSLPIWSVATLLAFMAARPAGYRDWPNAGEWIPQAASGVSVSDLALELAGRARSAWARTAYLLDRGGAAPTARELLSRAPRGTGPYYLGRRSAGGLYDSAYDVVDSTGMEVGGE